MEIMNFEAQRVSNHDSGASERCASAQCSNLRK